MAGSGAAGCEQAETTSSRHPRDPYCSDYDQEGFEDLIPKSQCGKRTPSGHTVGSQLQPWEQSASETFSQAKKQEMLKLGPLKPIRIAERSKSAGKGGPQPSNGDPDERIPNLATLPKCAQPGQKWQPLVEAEQPRGRGDYTGQRASSVLQRPSKSAPKSSNPPPKIQRSQGFRAGSIP